VLDAIISCNPLAPLHNPANVMGIQLALEAFDGLPQVAVFDTAFHQTLPPKAFRYPVPDAWYKEHSVRRYGFHGSSHRYVSGRAAEQLGRDVKDLQMVILHLGNGSSGSAIRAGESVDTTMGLTPLEGLVMGTRSGDIDPGLFAYMAESKGLSLQEIHSALNKKSGLLGLSGVSSDMQSLQSNSDHPQVELTLDVFYYRTAQKVLSLCAALDRLDALVFTGGIGENSALTRSACVESLKVLGLEVDAKSNDDHGTSRSGQIQKQGTTPILVVQTNEELMIAKDTAALI
jgi:acetate kinase